MTEIPYPATVLHIITHGAAKPDADTPTTVDLLFQVEVTTRCDDARQAVIVPRRGLDSADTHGAVRLRRRTNSHTPVPAASPTPPITPTANVRRGLLPGSAVRAGRVAGLVELPLAGAIGCVAVQEL